MNHLSTRPSTLATLVAGACLAGLLSACETGPSRPAASVAASAAEPSQAKAERRTMTGSRLPASDSTQIVRTVSGSSADQTLRSQPNPGRPGN